MTIDLAVGMLIGFALGVLGTLVVLNLFFGTGPRQVFRDRSAQQQQRSEEAEDHSKAPAKALDPSNPPTWRIYKPKHSGASGVHCACHDRPFIPGQPVMWWPVPDGEPGQIDLLCEEGVGMKAPVSE
jgi:hypothetical protein